MIPGCYSRNHQTRLGEHGIWRVAYRGQHVSREGAIYNPIKAGSVKMEPSSANQADFVKPLGVEVMETEASVLACAAPSMEGKRLAIVRPKAGLSNGYLERREA